MKVHRNVGIKEEAKRNHMPQRYVRKALGIPNPARHTLYLCGTETRWSMTVPSGDVSEVAKSSSPEYFLLVIEMFIVKLLDSLKLAGFLPPAWTSPKIVKLLKVAL